LKGLLQKQCELPDFDTIPMFTCIQMNTKVAVPTFSVAE
jgi:hypothetical protein